MPDQTAPSPEMAALLRRYLQIQGEEQRLKEEKAKMQALLADHLDRQRADVWLPEIDGLKLKVSSRKSVSIEYDEVKLRDRLGERYQAILTPDIRKIRQHLKEVEASLTPVLNIVGSPSPDKVRDSMEKGLVKKEEFAGAFDKTVKHRVSVTRLDAIEPAEPEA